MGERAMLRWLMAIVVLCVGSAHADLPDVIARIKPSVVIVGTFRATDSPRFRLRGTGFVAGDGNLVVTNAHVLADGLETVAGLSMAVQVRRPGGELSLRQASVLEVDRVHDLALLRFEGAAGTPLQIGDSDAVREGQSVAFMGFPIGGVLGYSSVTHRAMISSITPAALPAPNARSLKSAAISSVRAGTFDIFQLDATAYPGNSGGPLFDADSGVVLGVVNMVLVKGVRESALSAPSGISYAIPSLFVTQMLQRATVR